MKKTKKKLCVFLAVAACVFAVGGVGGLTARQVEGAAAQAAYDTTSFEILQAASVRKKELHGIRFRTVIGNDVLESWGDNYTMGTLIIPENVYKAANKPLTLDFKYVGGGNLYTPAVASMKNDESRLVSAPEYTDGKYFNAVLNLSEISVEQPDFLMQNLVARSFVTIDGVTTYADGIVVRSAAYVAASALDNGETDAEGILSNYVQGLQSISFAEERKNVVVGEAISMSPTVAPAGVFPVKYTVNGKGTMEGNLFKATAEGESTLTASVAGGKKADSVKINAVANRTLMRKYYQQSDCYTYNVYDVTEVKYGGRTLRSGEEYTQNGNEINVEKNVLCSTTAQVNELEFVSEQCGSVKVNVTLSYEDELLAGSLKGYANSDKRFNYFAYNAIGSPTYTYDADGVKGGDDLITETSPNDYLSQAYIADYYDSGMVNMMPQSAGTGENLTTILDRAYALGYTNSVLVQDAGIWDPYHKAQTHYANETDYDKITLIVPDGNRLWEIDRYERVEGDMFKSTAGLENLIYDRIIEYADHPAFRGIVLPDEPHAKYMKVIGDLYKAVENVYERLEREGKLSAGKKDIMCNLLPYYAGTGERYIKPSATPSTTIQGQHQQYKDYLQLYFTETGAKMIQTDIYSYYQVIYRYHMLGLQMTAEVAKANGGK